METKSLLIGIISFIAGALLVSTAATTFDKPDPGMNSTDSLVSTLNKKTGDDFDEEFISQMIAHHEGAVEMSSIALTNAKHDEIKKLAAEIINAQNNEIDQMKHWQNEWGYSTTHRSQNSH